MAPRHPAAPPSPGLGDYLGGKGRHRQRILRDVPKNHTNMIQSYLVQGTVLGSGTGQTQPRTNQNVPDARGEHSLLLALRDTSFFWGARDGGGGHSVPNPALGWGSPTHHWGVAWDSRPPCCCSSAGAGGAARKGPVTSQGGTHSALPIPSLEGEILLWVTRYRGLHKAVIAGNWCPGLLIAFCLLPNP